MDEVKRESQNVRASASDDLVRPLMLRILADGGVIINMDRLLDQGVDFRCGGVHEEMRGSRSNAKAEYRCCSQFAEL